MSSETPAPITTSGGLPGSGSIVTRCTEHPEVETALRCGRCETPICPKCMIMTPVGARCETCADVRPSPIFTAGREEYKSAILTGVGVAVASGLVAGVLRGMIPFFGLMVMAAVGYIIGGAVSNAANRRSTTGLKVVAAGCVLLSFGVMGVAVAVLFNPVVLVTAPGAVLMGILGGIFGILLNPFSLLAAGLAIFLAVNRI